LLPCCLFCTCSGADTLRYTSKPGASGIEIISFLAQAADGQQAAGMILIRVNSSDPMHPPANHSPAPRNLTATTLIGRYVTLTVITRELYSALDPDSSDLTKLKVAGAGPARKGGKVEMIQLAGNDTGIRYTVSETHRELLQYSIEHGWLLLLWCTMASAAAAAAAVAVFL
jgi:hypothetical protein